ncbi:hypothetical protein NYZ99_09085 [Maribacter litopenaei]|uniref:Uncharacterized protein n=1 Tax=Maribacter litopenaei TaxID=2976127 RepID=A0ABY5YCX7_9FLAO|nr:hypothetical protein [Maribacter litopenaei]UWX56703.1 hypothetical protein NYZ99_09085 [Maribacter litopenaei]
MFSMDKNKLVLLLLTFSVHLGAQMTKEQFQVIPGELPDPSIIEIEGTYYATGTTGDWAPIYPIYTSKDSGTLGTNKCRF